MHLDFLDDMSLTALFKVYVLFSNMYVEPFKETITE